MHHQFRNMPNNNMLLWIFFILLLIIVISIYMIIKNNHKSNTSSDDTSIKILDQRFAKGEIDEEKYIHMKKKIQENNKDKTI